MTPPNTSTLSVACEKESCGLWGQHMGLGGAFEREQCREACAAREVQGEGFVQAIESCSTRAEGETAGTKPCQRGETRQQKEQVRSSAMPWFREPALKVAPSGRRVWGEACLA